MRAHGRLTPEGSDGEFTATLMPQNRGIRVDHTTVPAFWIEALFECEDINALATKDVYLVERRVTHESCYVIAAYRRKGEAKRFAMQQECRAGTWMISANLVEDECFKIIDGNDDVSIVIRKLGIR